MLTLPDAVVPAELEEWMGGSLIDLTKSLCDCGLKIASVNGDFAGFNPRTLSAIVVADLTNQDLAQEIFEQGLSFPAFLWIESNGESGGWGLASRSGENARISRRTGDVTNLLFEIEPTIGANRDVLDLHYKFDVVSGEASSGRIESATTLNNGKPQRIATYSKEGMENLEVVLTGTVTGE